MAASASAGALHLCPRVMQRLAEGKQSSRQEPGGELPLLRRPAASPDYESGGQEFEISSGAPVNI